MDRKDQGRQEPTLADLEAFERLLRESLQVEQPATAPSPRPEATRAAEAGTVAPVPQPAPAALSPDQAAMAELARLIDQPVDLGMPKLEPIPEPPAQMIRHVDHVDAHIDAQMPQGWGREPSVSAYPATVAPAPDRWEDPAPARPEPTFHATPDDPYAAQPMAASSEPVDPLAAFEQELRRFDAIRMNERKAAPEPEPEPYATPASVQHAYTDHGYRSEPAAEQWGAQAPAPQPISEAEASLQAAEDRLAEQAAAAAVGAEAASGSGRTRGIFLALGGLAVAGGAVLGGMMLFGSDGTGSKTAGGSVPVIAARPEPAKERPANPGGMDIPNQNKQVLSPRNATDTQPAQVVNNTEQPLDLNQVTRRDGVRIVAPNPYQQSGTTPGPDAANPGLEPRRVTSIRIGDSTSAPTATTTTTAPGPAPIAVPAPQSVPSSPPAPVVAAPTPPVAPPRPAVTPPAMVAPAPAVTPAPATAAANAPKVETRPNTAQPRPTAPEATRPVPPAARAAATTPPTTPPSATPNRGANAPLVLSPGTQQARPPQTAARPAPTPAPAPAADAGDDAAPPAARPTSGTFAVQLASRPTEDDARRASAQLQGRFSAALGGKPASVVSGTANGQTVYRIRVGGYSQTAATEACNKVKAAGGNCFVTRQ